MAKKPRKKSSIFNYTYGPFAELMADPVNPLPQDKITYHMTKIYEGLEALDQMLHPEVYHWQVVADAANMLDTLSREMNILDDSNGVVRESMEIMARAWADQEQGLPNTLDHDDLAKLRLIVNSYMEAIETLPERIMVRAHRMTEKRMYAALNGNRRREDIVI